MPKALSFVSCHRAEPEAMKARASGEGHTWTVAIHTHVEITECVVGSAVEQVADGAYDATRRRRPEPNGYPAGLSRQQLLESIQEAAQLLGVSQSLQPRRREMAAHWRVALH